MKVRIKYCGGCNPRFDRKAVTMRLRDAFPEVEFVETGEDGEYDHVVVLNGCPAACASHEDLHGALGKSMLDSSEDEIEALEETLRSLLETA